MAVNALVGSRLEYCNSLFRSLSALDLRKLICVQNSLARIVTNTTKYLHITPVRKTLHWLPTEHHSIFETALLVYKFLNYPKIWNDLPDDLRSATFVHSFRKKIKTYLFVQAYPLSFLLFLVSLCGADPCCVPGS